MYKIKQKEIDIMKVKKSISLELEDMKVLQKAIDWLNELYNTIQDNSSPGNAEFEINAGSDDIQTFDLADLDPVVGVLELIVNSYFIEIL